MDKSAKKQYDKHGNAAHYDDRINVLTKMELIWGTYNVMTFCELTEFKYRMRMGKKPGQPIEQELKKANWYAAAAKTLKERFESGEGIQAAPEGNPMEEIFKKTSK